MESGFTRSIHRRTYLFIATIVTCLFIQSTAQASPSLIGKVGKATIRAISVTGQTAAKFKGVGPTLLSESRDVLRSHNSADRLSQLLQSGDQSFWRSTSYTNAESRIVDQFGAPFNRAELSHYEYLLVDLKPAQAIKKPWNYNYNISTGKLQFDVPTRRGKISASGNLYLTAAAGYGLFNVDSFPEWSASARILIVQAFEDSATQDIAK